MFTPGGPGNRPHLMELARKKVGVANARVQGHPRGRNVPLGAMPHPGMMQPPPGPPQMAGSPVMRSGPMPGMGGPPPQAPPMMGPPNGTPMQPPGMGQDRDQLLNAIRARLAAKMGGGPIGNQGPMGGSAM